MTRITMIQHLKYNKQHPINEPPVNKKAWIWMQPIAEQKFHHNQEMLSKISKKSKKCSINIWSERISMLEIQI